MKANLKGKKVAIVVADGFEQVGVGEPKKALEAARAEDFDALLLPRGVAFVKAFFSAGKPVAAICHGPWTLTDAGATWVDRDVMVDGGLVTSRKPADIPAFNRKMLEQFAE